jgi:hypothetical protein
MFQCVTSSYGGPSVIPNAMFWAVTKQSLAVEQQIQVQNDGVSNHNTLLEAAKPTHVLLHDNE